MKALCELKDMLEMEVGEITRGGKLNTTDVELAYKMVDIIKDIETIKAMEDYDDYSERGYSRRQRRDSRGRYSREGRYSRDESKEDMIESLEEAMEKATSDKERQAIKHLMEKLED